MGNLADWQKRELKLPPWAKVSEEHPYSKAEKVSIVITIDPKGFVPEWLGYFGVELANADQYHIECAFQCAKMDIQSAFERTEYQPSVAGKAAEIHISKCEEFALAKFKKGAGITSASPGPRVVKAGEEPPAKGSKVPTAREWYRRVRGALPTL